MAQQVEIDQKAVKALAKLLREADLTEIEYQIDALRIKVTRSVAPVSVVAQAVQPVTQTASVSNANSVVTEEASVDLAKQPGVLEAQMVGTVYLTPGPEADPFIRVGDRVEQGQTLFIIEAMKVMNMIKSPRAGVVKHIFVQSGQPVEYGDPIVIID